MKRTTPLAFAILATSIATTFADTVTSVQSGSWQDPFNWDADFVPYTGSFDSVIIAAGHKIINPAAPVGLNGSNDLGVANDQFITIDGGILSQEPTGNWIRIGHETDGTVNINDGAFFFTDGAGTAGTPNLQVGIRGAHGVINVGDGLGAPGSAVLNLWKLTDGQTINNVRVDMNLGASAENANFEKISRGTIVVKSDGIIEADMRGEGTNPIIRVGQGPTIGDEESSITLDGGRFNARGTVEAGANPNDGDARAKGFIHIENSGLMNQTGGELIIAFNGQGRLSIEDNGIYRKDNEVFGRGDIYIGRGATGVGEVTVSSGGQFVRGIGSNVGDLRIGFDGTGNMTVNDGGLVENSSSNWDWVGQNTGSNGTLTINQGGVFRTTGIDPTTQTGGSANLTIGLNSGATGAVVVNGGTLEYLNSTNSQLRIAPNGNGTFRQIDGFTNMQAIIMGEGSGTATFDLQGGTVNVRSQFFMGGAATGSVGNGVATSTQSGGTLNVAGSFVVGLATGHSATYSLTGGTANHTGGDLTVGESGTGLMVVGENATFNNSATGAFFVGRNDGSNGTLIVDGTLTNASSNAIRVGNGNPGGVDNTNGEGVLGGTGTISSFNGGIQVGVHGTITGADLETVGTLDLEASVRFSFGGTFFANFAGGSSDRINLLGTIDVEGAVLGGTWAAGGTVGPNSRYWLLVNDDADEIFGRFGNVTELGSSPLEFPNADGWVTIDGQEFAVNYSADFDTNALTGGNDLLLRPVPEPSTAILLGGMLCMAFGRRRRAARQA